MKRLLILWLTLFPAFWLAQTAASALLWQRIDSGYGAFFRLVTIPLLQTLAVGWVTRGPGPLPLSGLWREARADRRLLELLAVDAVALLLGAVFPVLPFPDVAAGLQMVAAGILVARLVYRGDWTRLGGIRLGALAAALVAAGVVFVYDWLHRLTDYLLFDVPPLERWLAVDAPLLAIGIALVLGAQPLLDRRNPTAGTALDLAVGLWLLGAAIAVLGLFGAEAPTEPWTSAAGACTLLASTALLAAVLLAQGGEEEGFDPAAGD
ncbi:MAG TPA: hypothetical protein VF414_17735 [Thermoanaerobaculia bacterium]